MHDRAYLKSQIFISKNVAIDRITFPTAIKLGLHVRDARRHQGLDQKALALAANVAVRSVHRVENGGTTVRLDVLVRILTALELDLEAVPRYASAGSRSRGGTVSGSSSANGGGA